MSKKIDLVYDTDGAYGRVRGETPSAETIWIDIVDLTWLGGKITFNLNLGQFYVEDLNKKQLKLIKKEIERVLDGLDGRTDA